MQVIYDPADQRIPIKVWTDSVEEGALTQAKNLTKLPFAFRQVVLLPDVHQGYGMPIGGVLAARDYIVPNAVGVDIGCGMHARRTNIEAGKLADSHPGQGTVLRAVLNHVQRAVPAGNGPVGSHREPKALTMLTGDPEIELLLAGAAPDLEQAWLASAYQIGTLGGGE
jgi:tRNA-splicing ligase RtcB (3'-phosphate/5'-hydroxy nucleic acid ligase)